MKNFLSINLLAALAGGMLLLSGCKKNNEVDAPEPTSTITGKFSPATAITKVTATDTLNAPFTDNPDADGAFRISNLKAGTYVVSFTPASGYAAPAPQTKTIAAGDTAKLGNITVRTGGTTGSGGTVTYKVNGATVTATTVVALYNSNILAISATAGTQALNVNAFNVTGPGTFPIGGSGSSSGSYTSSTMTWSSLPSGTGSIVVRTFSTTTRKASGTFSFTADGTLTGATGTKTITNGVFTDVRF